MLIHFYNDLTMVNYITEHIVQMAT